MTLSLAGGMLGAVVVAFVEARLLAGAGFGSKVPPIPALVFAELGVLVPLTAILAFLVGAASIFLESDRPKSLEEHFAVIRAEPLLARSRTAAIVPVSIVLAFAWCVTMANVSKVALARGTPLASGLEVALASTIVAAILLSVGLALLPPMRRLLAHGAGRFPRLLDPVSTGGIAALLVSVLFAWGVHVGDNGGNGGGMLGIFGVMKRAELDLRPIVNVGVIAACAYLAPVAFVPGRRTVVSTVVAAVLVAAGIFAGARAASELNRETAIVRAIERTAPLGKIALAVARKVTDRDHDGASPWFGGGDCDDRDPRRNPLATDVPGNGIDEDCSGEDLVKTSPPKKVGSDLAAAGTAPQATAPAADPNPLPSDLNVILVTVDTLRIDVGFMGYPKKVTPNLDALAAKGVVFDRAYAMASYTGKSMGPLLIGKYPSETQRDGGHFNKYAPSNVFLAERIHAAGIRTLAAASHWYFLPWGGLNQGIDVFDLNARPSSGQGDEDTSVTSPDLTDWTIRLLKKQVGDGKRFFLWVHYFDPHAQYMPHPGAPDFLQGGDWRAAPKAAYDTEVWFTDKHLGRLVDFVGSQPWGAKTAWVVTADHGEAFAEHSMNWHGYEIWESLVRVPLFVTAPGLVPHHVPVKRSHVDLVPTILDLLALPQPPVGELSGESLLPDLVARPMPDGGQPEFAERDVYIDMPVGPHTAMRRAIVSGRTPGMKLVHTGGTNYQLFDLSEDPGEKNDLSGDPEKMAPMLSALKAKRGELREIEVKPDEPKPKE
ncbi:MAG: sulfatase-like hydrolase/transferase [Polyangiaceae bacterium]